jgi:carboxypeptidase D
MSDPNHEQSTNPQSPSPEGPYYVFSGRGTYDIRHPSQDPTPPSYYEKYLAKDTVMNALGVDLNYTSSNSEIYYAFQQTGDFVWPNFITDLEDILTKPVRVALIYGDADYICNWFGGQAVSLATNYTHAKQFRAAGYAPFLVNGTEYGETREYGNFSFTRVYEAGHEVPFYQPVASLQLFNRTLNGWELPKGEKKLTPDFGSSGPKSATHTQASVALPTSTKAGSV